jgi:hypothetical protein
MSANGRSRAVDSASPNRNSLSTRPAESKFQHHLESRRLERQEIASKRSGQDGILMPSLSLNASRVKAPLLRVYLFLKCAVPTLGVCTDNVNNAEISHMFVLCPKVGNIPLLLYADLRGRRLRWSGKRNPKRKS